LIERARAVDHPRLVFLYLGASQCGNTGRVDDAVRYSDAGQKAIGTGSDGIPFGADGYLGTAYLIAGQLQRWVEMCRDQLARGRDTHTITRGCFLLALAMAGSGDEAMAAGDGLVDAAEATRNPCALSLALLADGCAFGVADPVRAHHALRRALAIAQDTGIRYYESHAAALLAWFEIARGDHVAALDYFTVAIHNYRDSGNTAMIANALPTIAAVFDQIARYESAAIIAGFCENNVVVATHPVIQARITHLRDVLGEQTCESLARKGADMTTAAMATFAYDQIDQARAELNAVSK
jgi:tetratricopeptide (TPR) repeat protein